MKLFTYIYRIEAKPTNAVFTPTWLITSPWAVRTWYKYRYFFWRSSPLSMLLWFLPFGLGFFLPATTNQEYNHSESENFSKRNTYNLHDVCLVRWQRTGRWDQSRRGMAKLPGLSRRTSRLVVLRVSKWPVPIPRLRFWSVLRSSRQLQIVRHHRKLQCPVLSALQERVFKWFFIFIYH